EPRQSPAASKSFVVCIGAHPARRKRCPCIPGRPGRCGM
ncbi:hypothetical protein, partial [Arthrobacter sp. DR-2P]